MKRIIITISVVIITIFGASITANAIDAEEIATAATVIGGSVVPAYEATVIMETAGRAGASTLSGAKGIVFEVLLRDQMNVQNLFNPGVTTQLSASSIDAVADLVTTDASGSIIELIQCKDGVSNSQIRGVAQAVSDGKYADATIYGTTEFSESFNEIAIVRELDQRAVDSGISTKTTTRIANKAFGKMPATTVLLETCAKSAGIGALVSGTVATIESICIGSDTYDAIAHVAASSANGAITMGLMPVVVEGTSALLVTAGVSGVVAATAPVVVGIIVPIGVGYLLSVASESIGLEEVLSNLAEQAGELVIGAYKEVVTFIDSIDIPSRMSIAWNAVSDTAVSVADSVGEVAVSFGSTVSDIATSFGTSVADMASDAGTVTLEFFDGIFSPDA